MRSLKAPGSDWRARPIQVTYEGMGGTGTSTGDSGTSEGGSLEERLRRRIQEQGVLSFAEFMEGALYDPSAGYYEKGASQIGKAGDYITSVSVGPMFGKLLAWRIANWIEKMPNPAVLEGGAHDGRLAADILSWIKLNKPELFDRLQFFLLEPSDARRTRQREALETFAERVTWIKSWSEVSVGGLRGVVLSNELLDAFPVRRLVWRKPLGQWKELGVSWSDGGFVWADMEPAEPVASVWPCLGQVTAEMIEALPDGFMIDASPGAVQWWRDAALRLSEGYLATFDYGLTHTEMLSPERREGTLRGYHRHRHVDNLLARPGEQDLTAHVDFDSIIEAGHEAGCATMAFEPQGRFLTKILEAAVNANEPLFNAAKDRGQFLTLIHPEGLGATFRVLAQEKVVKAQHDS